MPTVGFFCPSFSSIFKPSVAAPADPAVLEVARAIYYGGRTEGLQGAEAVAHVIQNRMNNPEYPSDALSVVSAGGEQFQQAPRQTTPTAQDKQLFDHAKRMATQLIYPPHRLPFPDPTGGRLESASPGATDEPAGEYPKVATSSASSSAPRPRSSADGIGRPSPGAASSSTPPPVAGPSSASVASAAPAAPAGDQGVRPSTPPPMPPPASSAPSSMFTLGVAPGPPLGTSSRLLTRPGRGPHRGGPLSLPSRLGPVDQEGYHDMILPCGLFQDEVIEFMYRDLSPEDFEKLSKLDERLPKRNTAQRNLVDRLPRVPSKDCGVSECGVCLGELESQTTAVKLPCGHCFHQACISKWLTQCKNTCPFCSAPITSETSASAAPTATAGPARSSMRTL